MIMAPLVRSDRAATSLSSAARLCRKDPRKRKDEFEPPGVFAILQATPRPDHSEVTFGVKIAGSASREI